MKSLPLRRSALAMLLGMALLTTGCAVDTATQPTESSSPPSATTPATPAPTASATPSTDPGAEPGGDCPAAPADAPAGTSSDPYRVGDEIVAGCFTIVVTELDADATHDVQSTSPDAMPAEGAVFAVVKVMVARTGGEPADVGAIGIRYASSATDVVDADPDLRLEEQSPPMGTLEPGQASGGTLVFEAANSARPAVVLSVDGGTEIWVAP
jgi:hypothetical protein